jgi:hypothetical protein
LEREAGTDIEFENYEGPVEDIDSREAIRGIGRTLGNQLIDDPAGDYDGRYLVTRIVGDPEESGLGADLLELGENARVDHIENLRRIVGGYLQAAWAYAESDADLIARFSTIYNAVNRGSIEFFQQRYRTAVVDALDPERAGLATSYTEWAGGTQMVLPIRDGRAPGALDAIDPLQLVDPLVIDELKTRADLGIEDRKDMIAFIERVIEERTEAIEEERRQLDEEQQEIDERQEEIDQRLDETDDREETGAQPDQTEPSPETQPEETQPAEDDAEADDAAPAEQPEDDQAGESDEQAQQEEPEPDREALESEQDQLEEREQEIEERQEELDEEEEQVGELTERAEELYDETAEDQAAVNDEQRPRQLVPFVIARGEEEFELAVVDFTSAEVAGQQTIPVATRSLVRFQGGVLAAHRNSRKLLLLDPTSLEIRAESDPDVVPGSRILPIDGAILTVITVDDAFYVGEFDAQLVLQRRSAEPVAESTDIVHRDGRILVQHEEEGDLVVLEMSEGN